MYKRLSAIAVAVFMIVVTFNVYSAGGTIVSENPLAGGAFGGGNGTIWSPYIIEDSLDLQAMNVNKAAHYMLGNDIDASGTAVWNGGQGFDPIGNAASKFTGRFDGKDHKITGLTINRPGENYVGLFGYVGAAGKVNNTDLVNANIIGNSYVGAMAGRFCGFMNYTSSTGSVNGSWHYVGGLIGQIDNGTINHTYSYCRVIATGGSGHGGVAGGVDGNIYFSYAWGDVDGAMNVGGAIGYVNGSASKVYAMGDVTATGDYAGGMLGHKVEGSLANSFARGNVTGHNFVGGFMGKKFGGTARCYSTGWVIGTISILDLNRSVGGFCGYEKNSEFTACYWDTQTSMTSVGIGNGSDSGLFGRLTAQMYQQATFVDWEFDTWRIYEGYTYPFINALGSPTPAPDTEIGVTIVDNVAVDVLPGNTFQYTVTIHNYGPINAFYPEAEIELPPEVTYVSDNLAIGLAPEDDHLIKWHASDLLLVGSSVSLVITVLVNIGESGDIIAIVNVSMGNSDLGAMPNDDSETTAINGPPIANNDDLAMAEDSGTNVLDIMANDLEPDGDDMDIISTTQGANGTVAIINGGDQVTYTPDLNFNGPDSFTYTIQEVNGFTDTATVWLNVTPVNDAPIANDDWTTFPENSGANTIDVLANDTDVDVGNILTVQSVAPSGNAIVLIINGGKHITYDPKENYEGNDTFTYTISDGDGGTDTASVTVWVTPVDTIINTENFVPIISTSNVKQASTNVTYSVDYEVTDMDTADVHTWTLVTDADWLSIDSATGLLSGKPLMADIGTYTVNVTVTDGKDFDTTIFTLTVVLSAPDTDADDDGVDDDLDAFPDDPDEWLDTDGDGTGNNADTDDDGDGVSDADDDFPLDPAETTDTDDDGIGDNADTDDDNDGVADSEDAFPLDSSETTDTDGDGVGNNADDDDDGDGVLDVDDPDPLDASVTGETQGTGDDGGAGDNIMLYIILAIVVIGALAGVLMLRGKGGAKTPDDLQADEPSLETDMREEEPDPEDAEQ